LGVDYVDKNHLKAPMLTNAIDIENIKSTPEGKEEARGGGGSCTQNSITSSTRKGRR